MIEHTGRTLICSVLFMDIVAYSKAPDARQLEIKAHFNRIIAEAVSGIVESERVILDTGDGAAICFLGDPEDALFVATAVMDALRSDEVGAVPLRMGLNLGPIKVIKDLNGQSNVVGDGINVAQRVMSFADDHEILVSRSYYEVVARLQDGNENLFRYLGVKKDKHVREHQIYTLVADSNVPSLSRVVEDEVETDWPTGAVRPYPVASAAQDAAGFDPTEQTLAREEQRLTALIGPLARVIVGRAARSAKNIDEFYQTLALSIQDEADRSAFLAGVAHPAGEDRGGPGAASGLQPHGAYRPTDEELTAAEQCLARFEGPIAAMLVRRQAEAGAASREEFYARLAEFIPDEADRKRFLQLAEADS